MKLPYYIVFLTISSIAIQYCDTKLTHIEPKVYGVANALVYTINKFFAPRTSSIFIASKATTRSNVFIHNSILDQVLLKVDSVTVQLDLGNELYTNQKRTYNVLLIDSYESFCDLRDKFETKHYDFTGYFLIVFSKAPTNLYNAITKILNDCWQLYITNVNILLESVDGDILMYTYFPFDTFYCGEVHPVIVNHFLNDTLQNDIIFPEKISNMHQCPVYVITTNFPPVVIISHYNETLTKFEGIEGYIVEGLADKLNFSIVLIDAAGSEVEPKSSNWIFKMLYVGEANLTIGGLRCSSTKVFAASQPYLQSAAVLSIPPNLKFTALERLILPFQKYVWIVMAIILIVGYIIIKLLQLASEEQRSFVLGRRNHYAFYNMCIVLLGGDIGSLPRRNFARYILMMWILLSIIVRTGYQGELYDVVRTDRSKSLPRTVNDVINGGYTLYVTPIGQEMAENVPETRNRTIVLKNKIYELLEYAIDFKNKSAFLGPKLFVSYFNKNNYRRGTLHIVKQRFVVLPLCMHLRKYSYLTSGIDETLSKFASNGLINHWSSKYADSKFEKLHKVMVPKPLNMYQLSGAFQLYAIALLVPFIVFLLELLSARIRTMRGINI